MPTPLFVQCVNTKYHININRENFKEKNDNVTVNRLRQSIAILKAYKKIS